MSAVLSAPRAPLKHEALEHCGHNSGLI